MTSKLKTELVFRSVGERTTDLSLQLALRHIQPTRVHRIQDIRPLAAAVQKQIHLAHDCDQVVTVDADCLILEDMTSFLEANRRPYVDCFVTDRFRGRLHCGVHLTRLDVIHGMRDTVPPLQDKAYVLRPESRLRTMALKRKNLKREFRNFNILHDHFQYFRDIFAKYALRELRSRSERQRERLALAMSRWPEADESDLDLRVAQLGVDHARRAVPEGASPAEIDAYIAKLPRIAREELQRNRINEKPPLQQREVDAWQAEHPPERYGIEDRCRVFGIGLSRTGTRSLTMALHMLGWDTVHYPADAQTLHELCSASYDFAVLREYHGITDITVSPYYAQLDRLFPRSKFILTVRDQEGWLRSARNHWNGRSALAPVVSPEMETYMKVRRFLRAAVYGCYEFHPERFLHVYDTHVRNVLEYFRGRPNDLLVLDICGGEGWDKLCPFLGRSMPCEPFPHQGQHRSLEAMVSLPTQSVEGVKGGLDDEEERELELPLVASGSRS